MVVSVGISLKSKTHHQPLHYCKNNIQEELEVCGGVFPSLLLDCDNLF